MATAGFKGLTLRTVTDRQTDRKKEIVTDPSSENGLKQRAYIASDEGIYGSVN